MASDSVEDTPPSDSTDPAGDRDAADDTTDKAPETFLKKTWDFIRPILVLVVVLFALRSSIADWNDVPTGSMMPTILEGDRIFVNKLAYDLKIPFTTRHVAEWADPKRGDIVVFFSPDPDGTRLVKRCVGVPGDVLLIRDDKIMVNGVVCNYAALDPAVFPYLSDKDRSDFTYYTETLGTHAHPMRQGKLYRNGNPYVDFGPVTIPQGKYFMMGDNRDNSRDSRWFGFVDRNSIVGRAGAVAISIDINHHWIPRWSRFFSALP